MMLMVMLTQLKEILMMLMAMETMFMAIKTIWLDQVIQLKVKEIAYIVQILLIKNLSVLKTISGEIDYWVILNLLFIFNKNK